MQSLPPPESARRQELERALRRLAAGAEPSRVIEEMSRRLANKLLHPSTVMLREAREKVPGTF
jgi:glutamyl-tRNA reductase